MNNGQYTLHTANSNEVNSVGVIEFPTGAPDQKVLVLSGIAMPEMGTNDDDDVGHPRVLVRLGRFVRRVLSTSVVTGLGSISNDESGFVLATDGVSVNQDPDTGELFLDLPCGLAGDGTYIHRIGYQAVCLVEEETFRIRGKIFWPQEIRDSSHDSPAVLNGLLAVRAGIWKAVNQPTGQNQFGTTTWQPYGTGVIIEFVRVRDGGIATYEIRNLPAAVPIQVFVDILPKFTQMPNVGAGRSGGPDPVFLNGANPQVDDVDFRLQFFQGLR